MTEPHADQSKRFCWLRFRRHRWLNTGSFRFGPGARGWVLRCLDCGHETATAMPEILDRAVRDEEERS